MSLKAGALSLLKTMGIGIPAEEQSYLFKAFFRGSNTHSVEGTGLGLNIVKRYVNLMNGEIKCDSVENSGTIFILEFPLNDTAIIPYQEIMLQHK